MITRKEYLNQAGGTEAERLASHRAYYAQFVTDEVKIKVLRAIGSDALMHSQDPHFNDIPLRHWDVIVQIMKLPHSVAVGLATCGDYLTLAGGVCICKEAARQIVEAAVDYTNPIAP